MLFVVSKENLKILKYHNIFEKALGLSVVCSKCGNENKKIFNEEESVKIFKGVRKIEL